MKIPALLLGLILPATPLSAAERGLTLVGEDGKASALSAAELSALPHVGASVSHDGKTLSFRGVLLPEVLKRVKAPSGKDLRGPALSDVVIVTASDGYTVALALSDLEPSIRPTKVILADQDSEGVRLGANDGPFRLVVDGDLKPARSARNVVRIELRRLGAVSPSKPH